VTRRKQPIWLQRKWREAAATAAEREAAADRAERDIQPVGQPETMPAGEPEPEPSGEQPPAHSAEPVPRRPSDPDRKQQQAAAPLDWPGF